MREMDKYLKENIEDYESVKRSALKYIKENGEELKKTLSLQQRTGKGYTGEQNTICVGQ